MGRICRFDNPSTYWPLTSACGWGRICEFYEQIAPSESRTGGGYLEDSAARPQPHISIMSLDAIDSVLRLVSRELWIVTARHNDQRGGLLATWISSASIDRERPVMIAGIAPNHHTCELIERSGAFGLHLIGPTQLSVAWQFALGSGREKDKFVGLETTTQQAGAPLLADCVAWLDCRVFARLPTGDRVFFWADVLSAGRVRSEPPAREQDLIRSATPQQLESLGRERDADVHLQRPLNQAWREQIPEWLKPAKWPGKAGESGS
jgi:flavin reductase (DIM6/NTAB) family NADH-FMN oxidoreductase RutF